MEFKENIPGHVAGNSSLLQATYFVDTSTRVPLKFFSHQLFWITPVMQSPCFIGCIFSYYTLLLPLLISIFRCSHWLFKLILFGLVSFILGNHFTFEEHFRMISSRLNSSIDFLFPRNSLITIYKSFITRRDCNDIIMARLEIIPFIKNAKNCTLLKFIQVVSVTLL